MGRLFQGARNRSDRLRRALQAAARRQFARAVNLPVPVLSSRVPGPDPTAYAVRFRRRRVRRPAEPSASSARWLVGSGTALVCW